VLASSTSQESYENQAIEVEPQLFMEENRIMEPKKGFGSRRSNPTSVKAIHDWTIACELCGSLLVVIY
jgi:hypothetical protein